MGIAIFPLTMLFSAELIELTGRVVSITDGDTASSWSIVNRLKSGSKESTRRKKVSRTEQSHESISPL